jgi:hypothetical protein
MDHLNINKNNNGGLYIKATVVGYARLVGAMPVTFDHCEVPRFL